MYEAFSVGTVNAGCVATLPFQDYGERFPSARCSFGEDETGTLESLGGNYESFHFFAGILDEVLPFDGVETSHPHGPDGSVDRRTKPGAVQRGRWR